MPKQSDRSLESRKRGDGVRFETTARRDERDAEPRMILMIDEHGRSILVVADAAQGDGVRRP